MFKREYTALLIPIPSASDRITVAARSGSLFRERPAKLKYCQILLLIMQQPPSHAAIS
jgi:hypothetical protein